MQKTFRNIIYNGLYQLVILILPIITVPYIAGTLGKEAIGINAYVNAIPVFLSVIILFGMNQFGARTVAQAKKDQMAQVFAQLWFIQLIVGLLTIAIFVVVVWFGLPYKAYFLLEIPFLLGYILDISWFFIGLGEIKRVVLRNTVIKLAILGSIFVFVHEPSDLWKYLLINSVIYLANMVFWFDLRHYLHYRDIKAALTFNRKYFMAALTVVMPAIAVQFYVSFDQTIVGWLAGNGELAYYQQSQLIARAIITMIGSISTILMPKMAQLLLEDDGHEQVVRLMGTVLDFTLMLSVYFTAAFMVNAKQFVLWFWRGEAFGPMAPVLAVSALIITLVSYGSVYANQYTLSRGLFKQYAIPFYVGAVASIVMNLLLVPHYKAMGGAWTIVATEALVCFLRVFLVRRELPLTLFFKNQWKPLVAGVITVLVGLFTRLPWANLFWALVVQTVMLTLVYLGCLLLLREQALNQLLARVTKRIRH